MRVEAECYLLRRSSDLLVGTHVISPDQPKKIEFLKPRIGVVISCKIENGQGSISIEGKRDRVKAVLYDNDDDAGVRVDTNSLIGISGEQSLSIFPKRRPKKEVFLFIDPLAGEVGDFINTLGLDNPQNSPVAPSPLVKV